MAFSRCRYQSCIYHVGTSKYVTDVANLTESESAGVSFDLNTKEKMQGTQVFKSEDIIEMSNEFLN